MSELTPAELFNKHAHTYSEKFMDVSQYADGLDTFCGYLPADAVILDIACGPGNIARYIQDKMPMAMLTGIDLAPDMLHIARTVVPTGKFLLMDCREIGSLAQTYNGIVCAFLLPYLDKATAIKLIADASALLNSSGVLYISCMEGLNSSSAYTTNSAGDKVFINYHEVQYLEDALADGGCKIITTMQMSSPGNTSLKTNDVIIVAVKE